MGAKRNVGVYGSAESASAQRISHVVSPAYPPLARQARIAGQATFGLTINVNGTVSATSESASHPLFAEPAKTCLEKWTFEPDASDRTISVTVYFGFDSKPVESNLTTTVTADFQAASIRVYVTTNPGPNSDH